jgi:hypothetical protein
MHYVKSEFNFGSSRLVKIRHNPFLRWQVQDTRKLLIAKAPGAVYGDEADCQKAVPAGTIPL